MAEWVARSSVGGGGWYRGGGGGGRPDFVVVDVTNYFGALTETTFALNIKHHHLGAPHMAWWRWRVLVRVWGRGRWTCACTWSLGGLSVPMPATSRVYSPSSRGKIF
eukprot:TRINITY_DN11393_c0_g1_i1.p2 TRINITY_DN11393_c0_g1~~TRINITY_DN11393_c0_g1_i1.p2  ORF type:complete len:107 (+),score=13.34 TRINITY_DN11393_c0_g1_i1:72-392(+)